MGGVVLEDLVAGQDQFANQVHELVQEADVDPNIAFREDVPPGFLSDGLIGGGRRGWGLVNRDGRRRGRYGLLRGRTGGSHGFR